MCAAALTVACGGDVPEPPVSSGRVARSCDDVAVRRVVELLGSRMKLVSLLAPPADVERAMREHYTDLVTPALLARWIESPAAAPGRNVSSPWPARIAIDSIAGDAGCAAYGSVVYATSSDSVASRTPVVLVVAGGDDARITGVRMGGSSSGNASPASHDSTGEGGAAPEPGVDDAVAVVKRYYDAIDAKRYRDAFALWSDNGRSSGQTFNAFAAGFAETSDVSVNVGAPSGVGAAAGSRYIEIPVEITARTRAGTTQHFSGVYKLRRAVVDGASAAQRTWRIYDADISAK